MKNQNLNTFIQIRVSETEKEFINHIARKHYKKGVSGLVVGLLYDELGRLSRFDAELDDMRKRLMEV